MHYLTQAVTCNAVAVALLILVLFSFLKSIKTDKDDNKVFCAMIIINLFMCIAEPITLLLDGHLFPGAVTLNRFFNFMLFLCSIIYAVLWPTYADLRIELSERKPTLMNLIKFLPAILICMGCILNLFFPVYFWVSDDNVYHRTGLFMAVYLVEFGYFFTNLGISYYSSRKSQRYVFMPAVIFILPIIVACLLQLFFYGISAMWVGSAIGLTAYYVALLNEDREIDALSGAYNRHCFNDFLSRLPVQRFSGKKMMVGIMLDIDSFKSINDRWGHMEGDDAIHLVSKILMDAANPKGTVYRFGGDEFTITMEVASEQEIQELIGRIHQAAEKYNESSDKPYKIHFSIGHSVYFPGETTADFVGRMDESMYESKKRKMLRMGGNAQKLAGEYTVNPDRNRILLVDGDFTNRAILKSIFPSQYNVEEAESAAEALEKVDLYADSMCAILMEQEMPDMDGIELLKKLRDSEITRRIPTFLIASNESYDITRQAYEQGVMDVISKPVVPFVILRRIQSVLELFHARESLRATVQGQEQQLRENADTIDILHRSTIEALASAIEFRDVESGGHINRIYDISKYLLTHTDMGQGFTAEEIENMSIGSIMHDVGKIAISDVILNKPGPLSAEEYDIMKQHTEKGAVLLEQISNTQADPHPSYVYAVDIARHHHERWDGRGYPDGLVGDQITPWSQVASIADVYDALVSPRVYKKAYAPEDAVDMILTGKCGSFSPKLLECFLQAEPQIRTWYLEGKQAQETQGEAHTDNKTPQEVVNIMLLTDAVKSVYDMIFSVNLTRNQYTMIDHETFRIHRGCSRGVFEELTGEAMANIPEPYREKFRQTLCREALLDAFAQGRKGASLDYPEAMEDGQVRMVSTSVTMIGERRSGDVLGIFLTRYLD